MPHKFDPKNKDKLESKKRTKQLPPKKTLLDLDLAKNDYVLDIGCAIGYFTIPAAEIVSDRGKVFAVDTSQEMLDELKKRLLAQSITNVQLIKGDEYKADIEDDTIDFILISNVIHEVESKDFFLDNYLNKLKSGGKIAIIDFKKVESESGPPLKHRISMEKLIEILKKYKIDIKKEISFNSYQYGIVGIKTKG
jgi:ubiquinone/menaquinone biosynthesis C-methylase UbiE